MAIIVHTHTERDAERRQSQTLVFVFSAEREISRYGTPFPIIEAKKIKIK